MKKLLTLVSFGVVFGLFVAVTPHPETAAQPDDAAVNQKVDARLKEVLRGLLKAQSEQASLR